MTNRFQYAPSMAGAIAMCMLGPLLIGRPETVATHYDITLRVDAWGDAGTLGPVLAGTLAFLFGSLAFGGRKSEDRARLNATGFWSG